MANNTPPASPIFNPIPIAAARLGVGRSFVYEEVKAGRLKLTKLGRRSGIHEAELQRYAAAKLSEAA